MILFHLSNMAQFLVCIQFNSTLIVTFQTNSFRIFLSNSICFNISKNPITISFFLFFLPFAALIESDAEGIGGSGFVECIREHIHSVCSSRRHFRFSLLLLLFLLLLLLIFCSIN